MVLEISSLAFFGSVFAAGIYAWWGGKSIAGLLMAIGTLPALLGPYLLLLLPHGGISETRDGFFQASESYMFAARAISYVSQVGAVLSGIAIIYLVWRYVQLVQNRT